MEFERAPDLIGEAPAFLDALAHASAAAALDRPLLISGERGAGKELFASRIHFLSPRWEGPLVKVNCAALSDELLESELFGHETGAFTGAQKRHLGRFERAAGGTIFLDEIPSASLRVQEKLLRIIEYGEYERLGGEQTLKADVRVVAAANMNLAVLAARGDFRADLLDRLAFDVVAAPPLRQRSEDIPLLADHFAAGMAAEIDAPFDGFTEAAHAALLAHRWPGNVRELKNAAERSLYRWVTAGQSGPVARVVLDPFANSAPLPASLATPPHETPASNHANEPGHPKEPTHPQETSVSPPTAPYDLRARLDEIEREAAENALALCQGSQTRAAKFLKLTYHQMRGLVRKHELSS